MQISGLTRTTLRARPAWLAASTTALTSLYAPGAFSATPRIDADRHAQDRRCREGLLLGLTGRWQFHEKGVGSARREVRLLLFRPVKDIRGDSHNPIIELSLVCTARDRLSRPSLFER